MGAEQSHVVGKEEELSPQHRTASAPAEFGWCLSSRNEDRGCLDCQNWARGSEGFYRGLRTPEKSFHMEKGSLTHRLRLYAKDGKNGAIQHFLSTHHHIDINDADDHGNTALHLAAKNGHLLTCRTLFKWGASLRKNHFGQTAADVAFINGHPDCSRFIAAHADHAAEEAEQNHKQSDAFLEGWLEKKGVAGWSTFSGWKKRYFVLMQDRINYFTDVSSYEQGLSPEGTITLKGATLGQKEDSKRVYIFTIHDPEKNREFELSAKDSSERALWERKLEQRIESERKKVHSDAEIKRSFSSMDPFEVVALYDYYVEPRPPFKEDTTLMFRFSKKDQFLVINEREGYLLVKRLGARASDKMGWIPGNYVSIDGHRPYYGDKRSQLGNFHHHKGVHGGADHHHHRIVTGTITSSHHPHEAHKHTANDDLDDLKLSLRGDFQNRAHPI